MLNSTDKNWILQNIIPLGKVRLYKGNGNFVDDPYYKSARFIKERTSDILRRTISNRSLINYPDKMINYTYHHVITNAIYQAPNVYYELERIGLEVENKVSKYINSIEHAVVLFGHSSVAPEIIIHTHRLPDTPMLSMTVSVRLTNDDNTPIQLKFYEPLSYNDPLINHYFNNAQLLKKYVENKIPEKIQLNNIENTFVFNAGLTPHSVNYSDDIVLYFIYDNVEFKSESIKTLANQSFRTVFEDLPNIKLKAYFL
jgi:hypothetical protein